MKRRVFLQALLALPAWLHAMSAKDRKKMLTQGSVFLNGKPLQESDRIQPGDTVTTGENSWVRFMVNKDVFLLRQNSGFKIHKEESKLYELFKGAVLSVYDHAQARFKTKTVTAGIRGTGMYAEIFEAEKKTYLCACYGEIGYSYKGKDGMRVKEVATVRHDEPLFFTDQGDGTVLWEDTKVFNHTDDELRELEAMVGRVPYFDTAQYKLLYKGYQSDGGGGGGYN